MIAVAIRYRESFYGPHPIADRCPRHPGDGSTVQGEDCDSAGLHFFIPCSCRGSDPGCFICLGHGQEKIDACPYSFDLGDTWEYVQLHKLWPATLPLAGGLYDQPASYIEIMRILDYANGLMQSRE